MFNPFNSGARPTPSSPKVLVLRTAARVPAREQNDMLHPQLADSQIEMRDEMAPCRFTNRGTSPIRMLRRMLRSYCQTRFAHHEGHHYPT
jgi:hypothetical protein